LALQDSSRRVSRHELIIIKTNAGIDCQAGHSSLLRKDITSARERHQKNAAQAEKRGVVKKGGVTNRSIERGQKAEGPRRPALVSVPAFYA
jgi:hypothetical protein